MPSSLKDFCWSFPHQWCLMMSFLWTQTTQDSFILRLVVAQSFICNIMLVVQLLWFQKLAGLHAVYISVIDFRKREITLLLWTWFCSCSRSAHQLISDETTPPSPSHISATSFPASAVGICRKWSNFMNQCYVSVKFPHLTPSSHQQGGHICVRQSSAGDLSHSKMDGNESAMNKYTQPLPFILSSLQQMLQPGSLLFPLVQCGSTFVYLSYHSGTCLE